MSDKKDKTLGTKRIFNGPLETVWKLWSDISLIDQWWGPKGFTQTTHKHEFREGSVWTFDMHAPNGVDYPNEMYYGEIIPLKKIVLGRRSAPIFTVTATFTVIDQNRTAVEFSQYFEEQKTCDAVKDFAILANIEHQIRFEALLGTLTLNETPKEFVIRREFNSSIDHMWKMFTEPELLAKWSGPKEVKSNTLMMDFRRGGFYHYNMVGEDGSESFGKVYYIDIVKNNRLVYVTTFSNKAGDITRHPQAPLIPAELLTTVTFSSIDGNENKTMVEIKFYPINANLPETKFFNELHESFNRGWSGSFDRLNSILIR
jgi:uncharacterized protein YndB with AHSA1/START domain